MASIKTSSFGVFHNSKNTTKLDSVYWLKISCLFLLHSGIKMLEGPARKVLLLLLCTALVLYSWFISDTLQIGLALANLTILPWLLIVIGFGLITAVSKVYARMPIIVSVNILPTCSGSSNEEINPRITSYCHEQINFAEVHVHKLPLCAHIIIHITKYHIKYYDVRA